MHSCVWENAMKTMYRSCSPAVWLFLPFVILVWGNVDPAFGDTFAPGQFEEMQGSKKHSAPSFGTMQSGLLTEEEGATEGSAKPAVAPPPVKRPAPGVRTVPEVGEQPLPKIPAQATFLEQPAKPKPVEPKLERQPQFGFQPAPGLPAQESGEKPPVGQRPVGAMPERQPQFGFQPSPSLQTIGTPEQIGGQGSAGPVLERQPQFGFQPGTGTPDLKSTEARQAQEKGFHDWKELWHSVWERSNERYAIRAASTVGHLPQCQGELKIGPVVEKTINAVEQRQYGEATKLLGQYQDRLQCVTPEGARGLDHALSAFFYLTLTELPPAQQRIVVHGAFNLGLLTFDQIQYTGRSWWLPVMHHHRNAVIQHLRAGYEGRELGLWFYDTPAAALIYHGFDAGQTGSDALTGPMFAAFGNPGQFAGGECDLLTMAGADFHCTQSAAAGLGGGGGGGGGGMGAAAGGGTMACVIAAAQSTGHHGMLTCMARAGGGGTMRHAPSAHTGPTIRGVLDNQCAMHSGGDQSSTAEEAPAHISSDEEMEANVQEMLKEILRLAQERQRILREQGVGGRKVEIGPLTGRRGMPAPGQEGTCADGTNAAQRVASLFACTGGSGFGGTSAGLPEDGGATVSYPAPGATTGGTGLSEMIACSMQGGGLIRSDPTDERCTVMTCPQGSETCSCDGDAGGRGPGRMEAKAERELREFREGGGRRGAITDPPRDLFMSPAQPGSLQQRMQMP
jgi:hypothetical protein